MPNSLLPALACLCLSGWSFALWPCCNVTANSIAVLASAGAVFSFCEQPLLGRSPAGCSDGLAIFLPVIVPLSCSVSLAAGGSVLARPAAGPAVRGLAPAADVPGPSGQTSCLKLSVHESRFSHEGVEPLSSSRLNLEAVNELLCSSSVACGWHSLSAKRSFCLFAGSCRHEPEWLGLGSGYSSLQCGPRSPPFLAAVAPRTLTQVHLRLAWGRPLVVVPAPRSPSLLAPPLNLMAALAPGTRTHVHLKLAWVDLLWWPPLLRAPASRPCCHLQVNSEVTATLQRS